MKDRIPGDPGRVLVTPEDGSGAFYAVITRADNPMQAGDFLNKNTLLKDETAFLYGLDSTALPDDIHKANSLLFGEGEPTENTAGAIGQTYYDTESNRFYKCIAHASNGSTTTYVWAKLSDVNAALFGARGPIVFSASGVFNIKEYGLSIGDKVNVVCIGGGGGGGGYSSTVHGGDGGKCGSAIDSANGGGGGGGTYGAGGGGAGCSVVVGNSGIYGSAGGGGGGYLEFATVTLEETTVDITIGEAGAGATSGANGGNGGTTSFGAYLSAAGGNGGVAGGSAGAGAGGSGGHAGGNGVKTLPVTIGGASAGGGGGGGGWTIVSATEHNGTPGTAGATDGTGGTGGTNGGAENQDGGNGNGAVLIWY